MKSIKIKVVVIKETSMSLFIVPEDTVRYTLSTPKEKGAGMYRMKEPVKISKKYLLDGSDELAAPDHWSKNSNKKTEGTIIIPEWVAIQKCIFKQEKNNVRYTSPKETISTIKEGKEESTRRSETDLQRGQEDFTTTAQSGANDDKK